MTPAAITWITPTASWYPTPVPPSERGIALGIGIGGSLHYRGGAGESWDLLADAGPYAVCYVHADYVRGGRTGPLIDLASHAFVILGPTAAVLHQVPRETRDGRRFDPREIAAAVGAAQGVTWEERTAHSFRTARALPGERPFYRSALLLRRFSAAVLGLLAVLLAVASVAVVIAHDWLHMPVPALLAVGLGWWGWVSWRDTLR